MVILNFTVVLDPADPQLVVKKILRGEKRRTMRLSTNDRYLKAERRLQAGKPVQVDLWWHQRHQDGSGHCFGTSFLQGIQRKHLSELTDDEWISDGFASSTEGRAWFAETYGPGDHEVFILLWGAVAPPETRPQLQKKERQQKRGVPRA